MKHTYLVLASVLTVSLSAQSPEAKKNFESGNAKMLASDYNGAIPYLDKSVELVENEAKSALKAKTQNKALSEIYSKRAICYYYTQSLSALRSDAETALPLDSTNGDAKSVMGAGMYKTGEKRTACAAIRKGILMGSTAGNKMFDDCFCWSEGVNLAKEGENEVYGKRYDAALKLLDQAIAIIPDSGYVYASRAKVYMEKNMPEKALADMNTAVYKKASTHKVYFLRAQIFMKAGKADSAFLDLNKCIELKKDYYDAILLRAEASEELGQWNAAVYDYGLLIKLRPDYGMNYYKCALVKHNKQEDLLSACDYYKAAAARGVEEAKEMATNCATPKYMKKNLHKAEAEKKK